MPLERRADNFTRLNYFDGLFLQAQDFDVQRDFHVDVLQYLNHLLFDEGRLYESEGTVPLEVTNPSGHLIQVSRGNAMVRHPLEPRAFELHLDSDVTFDLDDSTLTRGDGTPLQEGDALTLTIEPAQRTTRVGTASLVPDPDRLIEQATVVLRAPLDVGPSGPYLLLANLVYHLAAATPPDISATTIRGGIRSQIFSGATWTAIGGGSGGATLTTISVAPTSFSLNVGATQSLVAAGHFSDGSSRTLTQAADGLAWLSDDTGVATVIAGTGVVTGQGIGSTTIRANVGTVEGTSNVTVVSSVSPLIIAASPPPFIGARENQSVTLEGTQIRGAMTTGQATGTNVEITANGVTETIVDTAIQALPDSLSGNQQISFTMPTRNAAWPSPNEPVDLVVAFGGGNSPPFSYRYRP
jgi:hypothetical protein